MNYLEIFTGDALAILRTMPENRVHCIVTSPPYWGLRDYGADGQLGLEKSPEEYLAKMVEVFREARRVLRPEGTLWLNMGDSYNVGTNAARRPSLSAQHGYWKEEHGDVRRRVMGLKPKDLCMMPARLAIALQADGWWLRSEIVWHKPNPMPESVTDRPTKSHEMIYLLTKASRYFYDAEAIREPMTYPERVYNPNTTNHKTAGLKEQGNRSTAGLHDGRTQYGNPLSGRNARSVWTIATEPFSGAVLLADYVGDDGKPYKLSPDCPIHGRQGSRVGRQKTLYDEQPNLPATRNLGKCGDPALMLSGDNDATPLSANDMTSGQDCNGHIPANIHENKTHNPSEIHCVDDPGNADEISSRTIDIYNPAKPLADMSGSSLQQCAEIAIDHSSGMNKTALAPLTSQPYNSCDGTGNHIERRPTGHENIDSADRIDENNIAVGSVSDETGLDPSVQIQSRNARKSYAKDKKVKCTCQVVSIDHFATFPRKLAERCILAGTSERGCCPTCGKPWVRLIEKSGGTIGKGSWINHKQEKEKGMSRAAGPLLDKERPWDNGSYQVKTTGWHPTCKCGGESVPCTVLDPFGGSGTTAEVAISHGRRAILIELKPEYVELARKRLGPALEMARQESIPL